MKQILIILGILGILAQCAFANTYSWDNISLSNQLIPLQEGDLVFFGANVTLNNVTVFAVNTTMDIDRALMQGQAYVDAQENISVSCNVRKENTSFTIESDETYVDTVRNISYYCDEPVYSLLEYNLTGGNYILNLDRAFHVRCIANPIQYVNVTEYVCPQANEIVNISWGGNVTNSDTNSTYFCQPFIQTACYENLELSLNNGDVWNSTNTNITVSCNTSITSTTGLLECKQNITETLDYGELFNNDVCNIHLSTPSPLIYGKRTTLLGGEEFTDVDLDVEIKCVANNRLIYNCTTLDYLQSSMFTKNVSCKMTAPICVNFWEDICSPNDWFGANISTGYDGLRLCLQRQLNNKGAECDHVRTLYNASQQRLSTCEWNQTILGNCQEISNNASLNVVTQFVVVFLAAILALWLLKRGALAQFQSPAAEQKQNNHGAMYSKQNQHMNPANPKQPATLLREPTVPNQPMTPQPQHKPQPKKSFFDKIQFRKEGGN